MTQFKNKFYRILIILYSIVSIGSTVYLLLRPSENKTDVRYEQTKDEFQRIKNYLKQKDSNYQRTIDSLQKESDSLQNVISLTDERLIHSRSQANSLSGQLQQYVFQFQKDTSLKKNDVAFDSLSVLSKRFIDESMTGDSLCTSEINSLKEQIVVKETEAIDCDSLLQEYKSATDDLISQSQDLNKQLLLAEKKIKRSRNFNRLLSATVVTITGIFIAKLLIPH